MLVTQGTVATDPHELIAPTLRALAELDVLVVAAGVKGPSALGLAALPANARTSAYVSFKALLSHVDAFVTNGGFGGVQFALAHGVPIVAAGATEDKAEINNRIARCGVGINLKSRRPTPERVRAAVATVLSDPSYRERARHVRDEMAAHDGPAEAAALLEELARTGRPVDAAARAMVEMSSRPARGEPRHDEGQVGRGV